MTTPTRIPVRCVGGPLHNHLAEVDGRVDARGCCVPAALPRSFSVHVCATGAATVVYRLQAVGVPWRFFGDADVPSWIAEERRDDDLVGFEYHADAATFDCGSSGLTGASTPPLVDLGAFLLEPGKSGVRAAWLELLDACRNWLRRRGEVL